MRRRTHCFTCRLSESGKHPPIVTPARMIIIGETIDQGGESAELALGGDRRTRFSFVYKSEYECANTDREREKRDIKTRTTRKYDEREYAYPNGCQEKREVKSAVGCGLVGGYCCGGRFLLVTFEKLFVGGCQGCWMCLSKVMKKIDRRWRRRVEAGELMCARHRWWG